MDLYSGEQTKSPAIDREIIEQLRAEGDNLLGELVVMFAAEVPRQLEALALALAKSDAAATRLAAHTLKGTAANFGAMRMQTLAKEIEDKGRDARLDGASATLVELRAECDRVREALERVQ